jgi:hypothetical protein
MNIKTLLGAVCGAILFNSAHVSAGVIFYTDKSDFDANTTTALMNFEGIVSDTGLSIAEEHVIDGITYTTDMAADSTAWICGKDRCGDGLDSAIFVAAGSAADPANIIVDLTSAGSALTAAGGIFGDIDGPAGQSGMFKVYNGIALLGTFDVAFGDMGAGLPKTFFGWTTTGSDQITQIDFIANVAFSGLDEFQYGTVVPVPAAAWLFASGLLGLIGFARRKR